MSLYQIRRDPTLSELIATVKALGVAVKMLIGGDALAVAREIARGVGLPQHPAHAGSEGRERAGRPQHGGSVCGR